MKTKLLTALMIDQDPSSARQFSQNVKDIFQKFFVESQPEKVKEEYQKISPDIVFVNLGLPQRAKNFEVLETLEAQEKKCIFLGINDQVEEELMAHAIECGIHDIFVRPFDPDLISTKINRFFISEKSQERDLQYSKLTPALKAQVSFRFKLLSVDENGLTLKSDHNFSKGFVLTMNSPILKEIFDSKVPEFMITKTWVSDDLRDFFLYVEPKEAKEEYSAALRRFILRKVS